MSKKQMQKEKNRENNQKKKQQEGEEEIYDKKGRLVKNKEKAPTQTDNQIEHRWILINQRREQPIIPGKLSIESFLTVDENLYLNVSRKFKKTEGDYYVPDMSEFDDVQIESKVNKWGTKFKEVERIMAFLCYDLKVHADQNKVYTVCYKDRFKGIMETEAWRFHQDMDVPYHRVWILKCNGEIIWDRANKFSSI